MAEGSPTTRGPLTLGQTIRAARLKKILTLRELSRRLGITPSYLHDIEHDRRIPGQVVTESLCAELGLNLDDAMALSGRLGAETVAYLQEVPAAARLLRRMAQARLSAAELAAVGVTVEGVVAERKR